MAVAFMANAQHLMYRKLTFLNRIWVSSLPKTYEEMLDIAAEAIRSQGHSWKTQSAAHMQSGLEPGAGIQQHVPWPTVVQPLQGWHC